MAYYSIEGVRRSHIGNDVVDVAPVTLDIDYRNDPDNLAYLYTEGSSKVLQQDDEGAVSLAVLVNGRGNGPQRITLDGIDVLDDPTVNFTVAAIEWGDDRDTTVLDLFVPGEASGHDNIFRLGGDPLPNLATPRQFAAFEDSVDSIAPADGDLGPGKAIPFAGIPDLSEESGRLQADRTARLGEVLPGRDGGDDLSGFGGDDFIYGRAGNDFLVGGPGGDAVEGGPGADEIFAGPNDNGPDLIFGGQGRDTMGGSIGADTIFGGPGRDTAFGGRGPDQIQEFASDRAANTAWAGQGRDTVFGGSGNDTLGGGPKDDTIQGGDGADTIYGGPDNGSDELRGNAGRDTVFGGGGADTVAGQGGRDTLFNGAGSDTVRGGNAADTLWGGDGDDRLAGNGGADTFAFVSGNGADTIADFDPGAETIEIARGAGSFGDVDVSNAGDDVVIAFADVEVTLLDTNTGTIDQDVFVFS